MIKNTDTHTALLCKLYQNKKKDKIKPKVGMKQSDYQILIISMFYTIITICI